MGSALRIPPTQSASLFESIIITRVHDFQVEGDTACITMEYVPDSLDKHIRAGQPLSYQRAVQIACTGGRPAGAAVDVRDGRQVHVLSSSTG